MDGDAPATLATRSTCPYCGVGCGVIIESRQGQITGVRGDPQHPANFGRLCSKGSTLHLTASAEVTRQTRLLQPLARANRQAVWSPLGWDAALDGAAQRLGDIVQAHGPDALGFYVSGQLLTEDYYVFNKLAKGLLGTNNIDTNSRLCMSSAVAGYKKSLGSDAPPTCYEDIDQAQCLFIAGSNMAFAHPVLFRRVEDVKRRNPGLKIIVADPRRTDTAGAADLHLALLPGTDVMLFNGMLHLMLWEGWVAPEFIAAHTSGFEALKKSVRDNTPDKVARVCGLRVEDIQQAAQWFATSAATLSLYCQGLNQSSSGTAKNCALINLHLASAQIGKPGAGPFSLTGQPNAMGGREVGGLANLLSAHRDLANPAHRAEVAALWGVPDVPDKPGKTAVEMFQAAADGEIKALWIACTNPAQSMPDQATVRRALQRAEYVVVQEAFLTSATCGFADLLLPASSWGEKEGTVTNSERRISHVRAAVPAPGQAWADWRIVVELARRLERRLDDPGRRGLFGYGCAEDIWREHRASTQGRDLDITGLSYALLDQDGPQQWPLRQGERQGAARLYLDGRFATPDGRARFVDTPYRPVAEERSAAFPFSLTTGRLRDQWHGMSRTGTLGRMFGHASEPVVQMNQQDMAARRLVAGELVRVSSVRGSVVLAVQAAAELVRGQAFIAMHWGAEYLGGQALDGGVAGGLNALTSSTFCPDSRQPELKHAAVRIEACVLPWRLAAMAWLPTDRVLLAQFELRALMGEFPFASCVPFSAGVGAAERSGLLFRAAAEQPPGAARLKPLELALGLDHASTLAYSDARLGQRRLVRLAALGDAAAPLDAYLLAGDTRADAWMGSMLREALPAGAHGRLLLLAGPRPPMPLVPRGPQVCNCLQVGEAAIRESLPSCTGSDEQRLLVLQSRLGCGTQCGSCVPEIRRLLRESPQAAQEPVRANLAAAA